MYTDRTSRRQWCLAAVALATGLLAGCAQPARQLTAATADRYWSGRMSVQVQSTPPQTTSGSFELSGSADAGELILINPLGSIVARVEWNRQQASITQNAHTTHAESLSQLTEDLLGTALPIHALFDWLHGTATQAQGWSADLSAHAAGKITAQRTSPLPEASLRIVLDPA